MQQRQAALMSCLPIFYRRDDFMKNYIFNYTRVSTEGQNLDRQLDALEKYGVDMIYNEKMTGTRSPRASKNAGTGDGA